MEQLLGLLGSAVLAAFLAVLYLGASGKLVKA
jgi:hypothetical protein